MSEKMNRRGFLKGAAMTAAGLLAASCAAPTPVVIEKEVPVEKVVKETVVVEKEVAVEKIVKETVVQEKEIAVEKMVTATPIPGKFNEAPMLAEMVAQGKLPPVEDRVPQEPLVLEPYIEIGTYGGVWRQMHMGAVDRWQNSYKMIERIGKYNALGEIEPCVAKSWAFNGDATEVTINLRKGMKWSDGKPFTTADVMYWWNDVIGNDELSPSKPSQFKVSGQLAEVSAVDDYTFTVKFPESYGAFEIYFASIEPWQPAHYMKKFHKAFAAQAALDQAMEEVGVETWLDLYAAKTAFANNPGTPGLMAWNPIGAVDEPIQVWERNAYYWKVDTAGNQLPYLDAVNRILLPDKEAILLKAIAGEADFESRRIESVENYPTVMANREKGDYRVVLEDNAGGNFGTIFFNFWHEDEILRDLFMNKDFRIALSVAIDRDEINDLIYKGQATPSAATVAKGSIWYDPEFATKNATYDPDRANQLLDSVGLDKKDSAGFRLRPDGERFSVVNLVFTPYPPSSVEIQELVKEHWAEVGIEVIVKPMDRLLWGETVHGLDFDIATYIMGMGHLTQTPLQQRQIVPVSESSVNWGTQWGLWYETNGAQGEEPPQEIKDMYPIWEAALKEPDTDKRNDLIRQMVEMHTDQIWFIGCIAESDLGRWMVVKNNMGNVPDRIPGTNAVAFNTCLMFKKQ